VSISTDPKFYPVFHEQVVKGRGSLTVKGFPFGIYYWRVVAIDENSIEGYPSKPTGMFAIRPKKLNPSESIYFELTKIVLMGNILQVIGKTDPDNIVYINNKKIRLERDGSFKHFTEPFIGVNSAKLDFVIQDYSGAIKKVSKIIPLE